MAYLKTYPGDFTSNAEEGNLDNSVSKTLEYHSKLQDDTKKIFEMSKHDKLKNTFYWTVCVDKKDKVSEIVNADPKRSKPNISQEKPNTSRAESKGMVVEPDFGGKRKHGGKKEGKDPNAPKRPLSAFFWFSNEERPKFKAKHPGYTVGQVAKELGAQWQSCPNKAKYEALAAKEKERYKEEMAAYKQNGNGAVAKKATTKAAESAKGALAEAAGEETAKPSSKSKPPAKKSEVEDDDD